MLSREGRPSKANSQDAFPGWKARVLFEQERRDRGTQWELLLFSLGAGNRCHPHPASKRLESPMLAAGGMSQNKHSSPGRAYPGVPKTLQNSLSLSLAKKVAALGEGGGAHTPDEKTKAKNFSLPRRPDSQLTLERSAGRIIHTCVWG